VSLTQPSNMIKPVLNVPQSVTQQESKFMLQMCPVYCVLSISVVALAVPFGKSWKVVGVGTFST
jgi:hypothetical protein